MNKLKMLSDMFGELSVFRQTGQTSLIQRIRLNNQCMVITSNKESKQSFKNTETACAAEEYQNVYTLYEVAEQDALRGQHDVPILIDNSIYCQAHSILRHAYGFTMGLRKKSDDFYNKWRKTNTEVEKVNSRCVELADELLILTSWPWYKKLFMCRSYRSALTDVRVALLNNAAFSKIRLDVINKYEFDDSTK